MRDTSAYRFDDLGWLQFERLCAALLDSEDLEWEQREFGRVALAAQGVAVPGGGESRLAPPTLVVVAWLPPTDSSHAPSRIGRMLETELGRAPVRTIGSILSLTNVVSAGDVPVPIVRLGPEQLSELVDTDAALRLRVPSVLGIRDLGSLIDEQVVARSTADVPAASGLARVFVPTRAYARALDVLTQRRFVVLTGPPEMGKTAIARMISLAQMTAGWEAHECTRPEQLWSAFARDRPQVFVADDAFGSTEYRPDAADRWALDLDRVLRAMDDRHWLIWTSRPAPLKAGLRRVHRGMSS